MGLERQRHDVNSPAQQAPGKPKTSYPTPNKADRIVIEQVPISPEAYTPLPYHSPHPDYDVNGLFLVWQGPVKATNNQIQVLRVYSNDLGNDDWHNYSVKYSGDSVATPIFVRNYVELRETFVAANRAEPLKTLMVLRVTGEGTYNGTGTPTVAITSGGGSGATARAIMNPAKTKVIALELLTAGTGYTTTPTVGFSGGGVVVAATAAALIQPQGAVLVKEETSRLDSSDQLASLFVKVTRIYETLPGPWLPFTRYDNDLGPIQGRRRAVLNTGQLGGIITPTGKVNYEAREGSAIVSIELEENWSNGTGTPPLVNPPYPILEWDTYTDERGAVQRTSQIVVATGTEVATKNKVGTIWTKVWYEAFQDNPFLLRMFVETWVSVSKDDREVTSEFGGGILAVTEEHAEPGDLDVETGYLVVSSRRDEIDPDEDRLVTKKLDPSSAEPVLELTERGSGYATTPTVGFSGGTCGTAPTASAVLGFGVASVTVNNGGSGYAYPPAVAFVNGGGGGGLAVAVLGFGVASASIDASGSGYTSAPTVAITGDGSGATGTAILGYGVASASVTNPGSGYTEIPGVVFAGGGGSGAVANVIMGHPIDHITVVVVGSGYSTSPAVGFVGGGGTGATGTAVLGYTVASVTVNTEGSGYTSDPTVEFSGGAGSGAAATVTRSFSVASANLTNAGTGFTSAPTLSFSAGDGTGAAGTATIGYTVASAVLDDGGDGYATFPTVSVTGGGGTGATVNIRLGLNSVAIVGAGTGYAVDDILTIVGGTSTTAAQLRVTSVSGGGVITGVSIETVGVYSAVATNPRPTTGGGAPVVDTLTYASDGDPGVFDFIGTNYGVDAWTNPHTAGRVTIGAFNSSDVSDIASGTAAGPVDQGNTDENRTSNAPNSYWRADFGPSSTLEISYYSFRARPSGSGDASNVAHWKLQGSNDGSSWTDLDEQTGVTYAVDNEWKSYPVSGAADYRYIRILHLGNVTGANEFFFLSEWEFYGDLTHVSSGTGATFNLFYEVVQVNLTAAGTGYTSAPAITIGTSGGTTATAHTTLSATGTIKSITITTPGSGYTADFAIGFSGGGGSGAAATAVLSTAGAIKAITITNPGSLYTSAPTLNITGGGGSGATATAVLSATGVVKSVTLTNAGTGYLTAPSITFTGGGGSGATAACSLNETVLNVSSIQMVDFGTGYTSAPTMSFTGGGGGTGLAATAVLASSGSVIGVNITSPGTGYTAATIGFTGGAGSGAAASAHLATTGSVKSVTVSMPGSYKTVPSMAFSVAPGSPGSGAVATAVLASTGSVVELLLLTPGNCSVAPTVGFTGGGGSGAAATYHTNSEEWPVLPGFDTDPVTGIVVDIFKQYVRKGTPYPGKSGYRGPWIDMKPYDKWRSIQITSRVNLSTLPPPEAWWTTHPFNLPPTLLAIEALWSDTKSKSAEATADTDQSSGGVSVSVSSGANGGILIKSRPGFRGYADAIYARDYFFGAPPKSAIPTPFRIIGSSGSVVLIATSSRTFLSGPDTLVGDLGSTSGLAFSFAGGLVGDHFESQVHATDIRDHLVGPAVEIINPIHYSQAVSAIGVSGGGAISGSGRTRAVGAFGTLSKMEVRLPYSTPASLIPGQLILWQAILSEWRLGVWILDRIYIVIPS